MNLLNSIDFQIMGVMNVTPDSFSDGGSYNDPSRFYQRGRELLERRVPVLDIGAESTAPFNSKIGLQEEKDRLSPFIDPLLKLSKKYLFVLSLDSYRFETVFFFFDELLRRNWQGALLWNDISGVRDNSVFHFLKHFPEAEYVLNHNLVSVRERSSHHMEYLDESKDGVSLLLESWVEDFRCFEGSGFLPRIWWDPGFGFSKTFSQNEDILSFFAEERQLKQHLPKGLNKFLLGISKKSFLRKRFQLDYPESQNWSQNQLLTASEKVHAQWLIKWRKSLGGQGLKGKVLIRLHDPRTFPVEGS